MNNSLMLVLMLLPMVAMMNLIMSQSHFLMTLLSLEGLMLSLVLIIPLSLSIINASNVALSIIILTMGACEASLGLSMMVVMSRSYGTDMLKSLTMSKC